MVQTAQVAVSGANFSFDRLYTYRLPAALCGRVFPGSMVLVPFGRASHARMGVVLELREEEDNPRFKEIYDAAPESSRLTGELMELVRFLKERTFCTWYEAVKAVIPYGAQYKAGTENGRPVLKKGITRHTEDEYTLPAPLPEKPKPGKKQALAASVLADGPKTASQLAALGITRPVLENMCAKGLLTRRKVDRATELSARPLPPAQPVELSADQQTVYEGLAALLDGKPHAALLHGVTGSGKTLVFLQLLRRTLEQGRRALVLVPEIGLTPQMILRLRQHFGSRVAVQHSALSNTERLLQWNEIQSGGADIVVGTRSAIFAPLENIGLIVIDEEQEHTYHSESNPRYSAHEVASQRAAAHGALLLLASATPSTETYYAAQSGRIQLFELPRRYAGTPLPSVRLVDMRAELSAGNATSLSTALRDELAANLAAGQQSILLLNRRGYQTVAMCTECGEVLKCTGCSVPMVYHKAEEKLLCHYCGHSIHPAPTQCPACGGRLRYTGFGTQRVEEELEEAFPSARILRMDLDTTGKKDAHEILLGRFAAGEYDIMLGTQMVAKGLDFEKVTLVGVLGIDQMLFAQGFRSCENVFSLVTQVVGRSGRASTPGRALIQTVDPDNPVLRLAAAQDYQSFYQQEIAFRRLNLYPPFCTICMALFHGEKEHETLAAAARFGALVAQLAAKTPGLPLRILGPAPMAVAMVNGRYRYKLTIKCRAGKQTRALLAAALDAYTNEGLAGKASLALDFHSDADL